jgi:WD40 repeat protein
MYTVLPSVAGQPFTLFVWDADTGKVLNLGAVGNERGSTSIPTGAWLPDSSQVAIARPDGNIVVYDVTGAQEVAKLGKGSGPTWVPPAGSCSPGASISNTLAVVRDNNIWLIDYPPHQGGEHQLTKYGAPSSAQWAVYGLQFVWDCRLLFVGDPTGGLGAQGNGMAVYGVNLVTGAGADAPLVERGGRIQQLALSPSGNYLGITEDFHVNACIAAGDGRITTIAGQKVADLPLAFAQQGYHAHMYGMSFAPRGDTSLVFSYSQHYCDSPDPATFKSPVGPRIYLLDLNAPGSAKYVADGSWPAWNPGLLGLGTAPDPQIAAR